MRHILFTDERPYYEIAILIKGSSFNKTELYNHYLTPLIAKGISADKVIAFDLEYDGKNASAKTAKAYLDKLLPCLQKLGIKFIYCADATYFKAITRQAKADPHLGYVLPCNQLDYMQVVYGLNYSGLVYNPNQYPKLDLSINTLIAAYQGDYKELGLEVINHEDYPESPQQVEWFLNSLHQHPVLTCDIETFSLDLFEARLGSVAFAWNEHEGGSFLIDYKPVNRVDDADPYGECIENKPVRRLLRQFFESYRGKLIYHNSSFDIKVLILNLFMQHEQDYAGMLYGLDVMTRLIDDTKIIAYLALNSTANTSLSLKDLSHEYLGNYAQDSINDITKIYHPELLKYNLTDCLGTWYVYKKYKPVMIQDAQEDIYETLMKPSIKIILQLELVGMPIDLDQVHQVEQELLAIQAQHTQVLENSPSVKRTEKTLQLQELARINQTLKTKQHGLDKVAHYTFNPNSGNHLIELLYTTMGLPILDTTATKLPATGGDTLEKLRHHTNNPEYLQILESLIGLSKVAKIITAFIPAFKKAKTKQQGSWLHGNFNLGGCVSGRLSSSKPNLQNLPSGSTYGKLIKSCFKTQSGWIFASADFNALEAKVDALLTKDPAKLAVYTDGFDSHAYNTYYYWKQDFPEVSLLPSESTQRVFKITIDGIEHLVLEGTIIESFEGTHISAENYYDTYR